MKVGELIEILKEWPQDMPVAVYDTIIYPPNHPANVLTATKKVWRDTNYPFDQPDFEYLNIE